MNNLELLKSVRGGDRVAALFPAGLKLVGRKAVPEYKVRTGVANPLLIFPSHIVVNLGGRFGTPGVVDARNLVSVNGRRAS